MKKPFSILSVFLLAFFMFTSFQGQTPSNSEPPTYARVYFEGATDRLWVFSILEKNTNDGYLVSGLTSGVETPWGDVYNWVIKLSSGGKVEQRYIDQPYVHERVDIYCIQPTTDGGYITTGEPEFGAIKFSPQFDVEWARSHGGALYDKPCFIQQTSDGGYILAGLTFSFVDPNTPDDIMAFDIWVLKLSPIGVVEWEKSLGGPGSEVIRSWENMVTILQSSDGGYIFACDTDSFGAGGTDLWLVKLTATGDIVWQKTYGGVQNEWLPLSGPHIQLTNDGGCIVAANTLSFGAGYTDAWVFRLSSTGDIVWQKTYGGEYGDFVNAIQPTFDGGYVIAGGTASFGVGGSPGSWSPAFWLLKISADGDIELQKTYGGERHEEARCVQQTSDGGYIMAGITTSLMLMDVLIIKVDSNGELGPDGLIEVGDPEAVVLNTYVSPSDTTATPRVTNGGPLILDPVLVEYELLSEIVAWPFHQPPQFTDFTIGIDRGLTKGIRTDELKWREHPYNQENNYVNEKTSIYRKRAEDSFRYYEKIKEVDPDDTEEIIEISNPLEFNQEWEYALTTRVGGIESPKSPAVGGGIETPQTSNTRVSSSSKNITQKDAATPVQPKSSQDILVKSEQPSRSDKQFQTGIQPPVNVTVTRGENSQIIRWEQNPLNNPESVNGYQVYRVWGEGDDTYYEFIGWVSSTESEFVDYTWDPDKRLRYVVTTVDVNYKESSKKPVKKIG